MPEITVNGVTLYYEIHGSGDETVVFNNGSSPAPPHALPASALTPHYACCCTICAAGQIAEMARRRSRLHVEQHADDWPPARCAGHPDGAHRGISYGGELTMVFALPIPNDVAS